MPRGKKALAVAASLADKLPPASTVVVDVPTLPPAPDAAKSRIPEDLLPRAMQLFRRVFHIPDELPESEIVPVDVIKISSRAEFDVADAHMAEIGQLQKAVEADANTILLPIKEAKKKLDESSKATTALMNRALRPLQRAEAALRLGMSSFLSWEKAEVQRIEDARTAEARRIETERLAAERQAAQLREQEQAAKTAEMREYLRRQREVVQQIAVKAEEKVDAITAAPLPQPVAAANTTSRTIRKIRITNKLAFIKAVAAGDVPDLFVNVDETAVEAAMRQAEAIVKTWPGVEIYDHEQIVRR